MSRLPTERRPPVVLEGADERGTPHEILTPEGVPLLVRIADPGDRAAAFVLDALFLGLTVLALGILAALLGLAGVFDGGGGLVGALLLLAFFLLRNFYFTWHEARRGATPGKRRLGLRVIDARGGPLTFEAVLARNLLREIEVFVPLVVLFAPDGLWPGAPGAVRLVSGLWALLLATMPLYNRRRMRAGDMVAGTLVVKQPKAVLLRDVVSTPTSPREGRPSEAVGLAASEEFPFTDAQLDIYGTYELQVLEEVLRGARDRAASQEARRVVAERICRKIGWSAPLPSARSEAFLRAFYAALRARLEHRMLLGHRKEDQHTRS